MCDVQVQLWTSPPSQRAIESFEDALHRTVAPSTLARHARTFAPRTRHRRTSPHRTHPRTLAPSSPSHLILVASPLPPLRAALLSCRQRARGPARPAPAARGGAPAG